MEKKDIHVVFNESAGNTLLRSKVLDPENSQIITLHDCQNIGPVCSLTSSKEEQGLRTEWLVDVYGGYLNPYEERVLRIVEEDLHSISTIINYALAGNKIYLWTGMDGAETAATGRLINYLPNNLPNILKVDFPGAQLPSFNERHNFINLLHCVKVTQVAQLMENFHPLTQEEYSSFKQVGKYLLDCKGELRILQDDFTLKEEKVSYFDQVLIDHCNTEFKPSALTVGYTLMAIDFQVGDGFLNWRLRELAKSNGIAYKGELKGMRDYEVKRPSGAI